MKYIIHHKDLLGTKERQHVFEGEVAKKIRLLEKILSGYFKYLLVEIYISTTSPGFFRISVSLKLKSNLLYHEAEGEEPAPLINALLGKLRNSVKKQLALERREYLFKRKARRKEAFGEFTYKLDQLYAEKEREQFNHLIQQLLPSLKQYTLRFLKMNGKGRKLTLTIQEILDEIYIALFERFSERPPDPDQQPAWCYMVAHETVKKILERDAEDAAHQVDLQDLVSQEIRSLEEKFTTDADGDLIMYEELDDISYRNKMYGPEILPDDHLMVYLNDLTAADESSVFHQQVSDVLKTCDELERHVFELYWLDELTEDEISKASGMGVKEVKEAISSVTQKIVVHLKN